MKKVATTTTGHMSGKLNHCGDYAGEFMNEAYDIINGIMELEPLEGNQWADIMYFSISGEVVAVLADDALTCHDAELIYVYLDREDCPRAFAGMEEKELY